jgi:hypothetical protein
MVMKKTICLILALIILQGCSNYGLNDAINDNAVIEGPGGPKNVELLDQFIESIAANKKSELRIVSFDDEGGAKIADISYSDEKISYKRANQTATCEGIRIENQPTDGAKRQYILTTCDMVIGMEGPEAKEIVMYRLFK